MVKIILKEVAEITIVVVKSYSRILVLAVTVTARQGFSTVKNAVANVNDCWPAVILSTTFLLIKHISSISN